MMVLMVHLRIGATSLMSQAVDGFLLMSGWLNAQSMDQGYKKTPTKLVAAKNFFIHRFFRIVPIYYLCIFFVIVLMGPARRELCLDTFFE